MPNERLTDELLALESIYPDVVTWTETAEGSVDLEIRIKVDFEQPRTVVVEDYEHRETTAATPLPSCPLPRTGASCRQDAVQVPPNAVVEGRSKRTRSRGKHPSAKALASEPSVVETPPRSASAASTLHTSSSTPAPPRVTAASTSIPLSHSKTPRISFVPRPPSPPPPPVHEVAEAISALDISAPSGPQSLVLRYLPPLRLSLRLPPNYPESSGPERVDLKAEGDWLGESNRLHAVEKLNQAYLGDECLFGMAELVSSASPDFFPTLSLSDPIRLTQRPPLSSSRPSGSRLSDFLVAYDHSATTTAFSDSSHECPLCFAPRKGSNCIRLDACGCTFCIPCLRDYFSMLITEGMVRSVACPAIGCVQDRAKWEKAVGAGPAALDDSAEAGRPGRVTGKEVERLCGAESRARFEWLKEKIRIESDPSISFCPRETCQAPTPKLDDDKLRVCSSCQFAYCVFCRKGWHGTRNACSLPESNRLVTQYLAADEAEKRTLEQRYGASNLKRLVAAFEEEKALQEWLKEHSTPCPGCSVPIEKSHGCNHMTCGKCGTHLCYRCGKSISPTEPYRHFNTPSSICFGKLFDFSPGQEPPVEAWLGELLQEDVENGH
ncbi:hypothetical protein JCM11491_005390 [Sporobolomyces phaffii]